MRGDHSEPETMLVLDVQAEAIRQTGDAYARTKLTPFVKKLFVKLLKWRRSG